MALENLKKWEKELNTCIRCGYCYENCHIFKLTNWESDTPRGKLILAYGMINGDIEPTEDIAKKIFECFYCRLCEAGCSAKVPVTEILTDVRQVLLDDGFDVEGTHVEVDEDKCCGCGICVSVCKPEATTLKEENGDKLATVDKVKCEACGVCTVACPSGARELKEGYEVSRKELDAKIDKFVKEKLPDDAKEKTVTFCCNWSVFPGLRLSVLPFEDKESNKTLVTMCTGRVDPEMIVQAMRDGIAGVLISACPLGECEHDANYKTLRRVLLLKKMLQQLNIEPERVKLTWVDTNEVAKLEKEINSFSEEVSKLGTVTVE
ncbi:hydrogenase iron-sulfur subunit [bacterium]|nr:hydrogenase iron-sulfur subunit [bacterium]